MSAVWKASQVLLGILAGLLIAGVALWGSLALYYRAPFGGGMRQFLGAVFALLGVAAIIGRCIRSVRRPAVVTFVVAFALLLVWWGSIEPRNDRDWQPEVAVLPYAEMHSDLASGYVPLLVYEHDRLDTRLPFEELRRRGHINEAAHAAGDAADFSQRIRSNVPAPAAAGAQ